MTIAAEEIVGRDDALLAVGEFFEGEGRALVLEGAAGIGKTVVWLAGIELARRRGHEVLLARPAGTEVKLSLAGLGDLLRGFPERVFGRLQAPQRRVLAVALAEEEANGAPLERHMLGIALLNLLRLAAEESPVLVAIDDLQWLDESSGAVILFALRRVDRPNVRLLASCRSEPGTELPFDLEHSFEASSLLRLPLGPLSEGAIRRLLRERLGLSISRSLLHALYEATRGNPFYALELARAGLEQSEDGPLRLPGGLQSLVRRRLQTLPDSARDALVVAAALSEPTSSALRRAGILEALGPAIEAGVLESDGDGLRFGHPLIAAAAWGMAAPERRREAHRLLAEATEDVEQRARHLALAAESVDPEIAGLLESAAVVARARGATAAAADLLEGARRLTPEDDLERWARLAGEEAAAHAACGEWDRLMELVEEAQTRLPAGPDRAAVLAVAAEMRPGLADLLREAVEEAGEGPVGVRARIGLAEQASTGGRWTEAIETACGAVELARRLGIRDLLGAALTSLAGNRLLASQPEGHEDLAEALALERELGGLPTSAYSSPTAWRMYTLLWADDLGRAKPLLEEQLRKARDEGDEVSAFQLLWQLGFVELAAGDPSAARIDWREGLEPIERLGYEYVRTSFLVLLAAIEAHEGRLEQARNLNAEALPLLEATGDCVLATAVHASMLFVELCDRSIAEALAHAAAISSALPEGRESWWSRHQGDEVEALVLAGEHQRARERIESLRRAGGELSLPRFLAWAERGQGLLLAAQGDLAAAREALVAALRQHESVPLPLERARTLLVYGNVLRRRNERRSARAVLTEARVEFERIKAGHFVRLAGEELKHVAGRRRTPEGELTEAEERVALLVAEGLSNRDVAARLYLSISTIEATLTRVYAKLGVRSRFQLARLLRDEDPAG